MTTSRKTPRSPQSAKDKPQPTALSDVIEDPEILEALRQPLGSPIDLSREQALVVLRAGMGGRPDFPTGEEFVNEVRGTLGIRVRG